MSEQQHTRLHRGMGWAAVSVALALLAAPAQAETPWIASLAGSDTARHWLVLNFDQPPVGQQIAEQGNAALRSIRAGIAISAPEWPARPSDVLGKL